MAAGELYNVHFTQLDQHRLLTTIRYWLLLAQHIYLM